MKKWCDLSGTDRNMLLVYEKSLLAENPSLDEIDESRDVTKYCLENSLDISQIPKKVLFDEAHRGMATEMSPFTFWESYEETIFVDESGSTVDVKNFMRLNNVQTELVEMFFNDGSIETLVEDSKEFKKKCEYLAESINKPSWMGSLLLNEMKLGDKTMPELINRAVNIGLLDKTFYVGVA